MALRMPHGGTRLSRRSLRGAKNALALLHFKYQTRLYENRKSYASPPSTPQAAIYRGVSSGGNGHDARMLMHLIADIGTQPWYRFMGFSPPELFFSGLSKCIGLIHTTNFYTAAVTARVKPRS